MRKKVFFTDLPTLFFMDRYRKQTISFFRPYLPLPIRVPPPTVASPMRKYRFRFLFFSKLRLSCFSSLKRTKNIITDSVLPYMNKSIFLVSSASGHHLDIQTLKQFPSGHPNSLVRNFVKCQFQAYIFFQLNIITMTLYMDIMLYFIK